MPINREKSREVNKGFFNAWASFYDFSPLKPWLFFIQKELVKAIPIRELTSEVKILDVGCGTGDALLEMSKRGTAKLYGIDLSEGMLNRAKKKLKGIAILRKGDVEHTGFKDSTFDYVLCTEAFHHFPNPNTALREMHRVLKKEGTCVIADINFFSKTIHKLFRMIEPGHVKIYNKEEMRQLFEKNKFRVLKQGRIAVFALYTIAQKSS